MILSFHAKANNGINEINFSFQLDMEKALVSAELSTERDILKEMEKNLSSLQSTIHRLEAQRNSNRVMQETQQTKLKQMIDVAQDQMNG